MISRVTLTLILGLNSAIADDEPLNAYPIEDHSASFQPEESLLPQQAAEHNLPLQLQASPSPFQSPVTSPSSTTEQIISPEQEPVITAQPPSEEPSGEFVNHVVLGALDKVTARVSHLNVKVDESVPFGTLTIKVRKCWQASPEDTPEVKAFLEITEKKPNKPPLRIFNGWMFASNPSVITLEHPVYDVWVTLNKEEANPQIQPASKDEASQKLDNMLNNLLERPNSKQAEDKHLSLD